MSRIGVCLPKHLIIEEHSYGYAQPSTQLFNQIYRDLLPAFIKETVDG